MVSTISLYRKRIQMLEMKTQNKECLMHFTTDRGLQLSKKVMTALSTLLIIRGDD